MRYVRGPRCGESSAGIGASADGPYGLDDGTGFRSAVHFVGVETGV
ncbi:MAG: hypothetical protein NQU42_07520 [Methanothrix sp.]|nr:hypothetical protein [Methanothrix sp.]MCQ8903922.1 hypothetical protein [Methanothrix sp.]